MTVCREVKATYTGVSFLAERVGSSRDLNKIARKVIPELSTREHFAVFSLDNKNIPVAYEIVGIGTVNKCLVEAVDVARFAILSGAVSVLLAHNHPSGEPTPSPEDLALTERLRQALDIFNIKVLDHIVIGQDKYFSFLDSGLLEAQNV